MRRLRSTMSPSGTNKTNPAAYPSCVAVGTRLIPDPVRSRSMIPSIG
jgi:hypothetical protein